MPELPEVETTRRGIAPYIKGQTVSELLVRNRQLRWPIPRQLNKTLTGRTIHAIERRGKYILFYTSQGCLLLHLGMSGSLRILKEPQAPNKHDHVDIRFNSGVCLRFTDPRRFGSIHWTSHDPLQHALLKDLGPEPLGKDFNADYLFIVSRKRIQSIKTFIMNSHIVVGVGNIYANEALFAARIHPLRRAGKLSKRECNELCKEIKTVLTLAIEKGGTTLRDFVDGDGKPGYFRHELQVYDKAGDPCPVCNKPITLKRIGQRSSFYCTRCQS